MAGVSSILFTAVKIPSAQGRHSVFVGCPQERHGPATLPAHNLQCSGVHPKARSWNGLFLKKTNLLFEKRPRSASRGHNTGLCSWCTKQRWLASRSKLVDVSPDSVHSETASHLRLHTKRSNFILKLLLQSILCFQAGLALCRTP